MVTNGWYALEVRSRYERFAEAVLSGKGYQVFFPTYRKPRATRGKVRDVPLPLFPGYLFCHVDAGVGGQMVTTPGVIRIVRFGPEPALISDREIEYVRSIVNSQVACRPWHLLVPGTTVRIETGPLRGVEGTLVVTGRSRRLIVSIPVLTRSIVAQLDSETVVTTVRKPPGAVWREAQPLARSCAG